VTLAFALRDLTVDWGSYYSNHAVLRTLIAFAHVGGLVVSGGAAIVADRGVLAAIRRGDAERTTLLTSVRNTHAVVLIGLVTVMVSGVFMFAADVDTYIASRLFWTKMALIVLLMINGLVLTRAERRATAGEHVSWGTLRWTAIASLALWFLTTLTGTGLLNMG
jgi:cytochrome b subunit of formate dehydrogenase